MEQCAIRAVSSQLLEFVGSVQSVPIMTFAQFATMVISTIWGTDSIESLFLEARGKIMDEFAYVICWSVSCCVKFSILEKVYTFNATNFNRGLLNLFGEWLNCLGQQGLGFNS